MSVNGRLPAISFALVCLVVVAGWSAGSGVECRFFDMDPSPAVARLADGRPGLLRESFMKPDFSGPATRDLGTTINHAWVEGALRNFSARWTGWLDIPVDGPVRFGLVADDAALLIIDDVARLHNWGYYYGSIGRSNRWITLDLGRGFHTLRLDYTQVSGAAQIQLWWQFPGEAAQVVPPEALWHVPVTPQGGATPESGSLTAPRGPPVPPGTLPLTVDLHEDLDFERGMRLFIPFVACHDGERRGHPSALGPLCARWTTRLVPPSAGPVLLHLVGSGELELTVGNRSIRKPIALAERTMQLDLAGDGAPLVLDAYDPGLFRRLRLEWTLPGAARCPVPPSAFRHPDASGRRGARAALLLLTLLALVVMASAVGGVAVWRSWMWHRRVGHAFVLCLLVGSWMRLTDLTLVPGFGETWDEANSHFLGTHLVSGLEPTGWDSRDVLPLRSAVMVHGVAFRIVAPMVHYPPLYHTLVGLVNRAAGARALFDMRLTETRAFSVLISVLTLALLWPAARGLGLRPVVAALACAFLAVYPTAVLQSRLVKEENLVSLLYMAVLVLVTRSRDSLRRRPLWLAGLCVVLAILTKQLGAAAGVLAVVLSLTHGRPARALWFGLVTVLGIGLFTWYGLFWAGDWFYSVQRWNSMYSQRVDALWPLVAVNTIVQEPVASAWVVGLWLATALAGSSRPGRGVLLAVACYMIPLTVAYPSHFNFGWYRIPLLPLWGLAWGEATRRLAQRLDPLVVLLWVGCFVLPTAQILNLPQSLRAPGLWPSLTEPEAVNLVLKGLVVVLVGPALVVPALPDRVRKPVSRAWTGLVVLVILVGFGVATQSWNRLFPPQWRGDPVVLRTLP